MLEEEEGIKAMQEKKDATQKRDEECSAVFLFAACAFCKSFPRSLGDSLGSET